MLCQSQGYRKVHQLYTHIYPLFFSFFFHIGLYGVLGRVQSSLCCIVGPSQLLFCIQQYVYAIPKLPIYRLLPQPLVTVCVLCVLNRVSHVSCFATPWNVAHQASLSMGFSKQEYWSGLLCPPPGDLPHPVIKPVSLMSPAFSGMFFTTSTTWEAQV